MQTETQKQNQYAEQARTLRRNILAMAKLEDEALVKHAGRVNASITALKTESMTRRGHSTVDALKLLSDTLHRDEPFSSVWSS